MEISTWVLLLVVVTEGSRLWTSKGRSSREWNACKLKVAPEKPSKAPAERTGLRSCAFRVAASCHDESRLPPVSVVAGGPKTQPGETRGRNEERRGQRDVRGADGAPPTQVALDDGQYADAYATDYGYPARRARRAEAALDRPRPEPRIAEPGPAVNLPTVREMPLPVRR